MSTSSFQKLIENAKFAAKVNQLRKTLPSIELTEIIRLAKEELQNSQNNQ